MEDTPTATPTSAPAAPSTDTASGFPIVPVAVGAGALLIVGLLSRG